MTSSELLEAMIGAAQEAGEVIERIYAEGFAVATKADASPVTAADHAAERLILDRLGRCAPQLPVVAEEEVAAGRTPDPGKEFFLVDPLDGTKEFIERRGDFTVNIALIRLGRPALGVVLAPARGVLFAADATSGESFRMGSKGGQPGARVPLHVRSAPTAGLTAVASRSHSTPETDAYLARYRIAERISIGSSLKFCLIAAAEADLYPRLGTTMEWDTAAGHAVLLGAGGKVAAPDGTPLRYGKPRFINSWFVASGAIETVPLEAVCSTHT